MLYSVVIKSALVFGGIMGKMDTRFTVKQNMMSWIILDKSRLHELIFKKVTIQRRGREE